MSFDLSGLQAYTDQLSPDLIQKATLRALSTQMLTVLPGKTAGTTSINLLNSNAFIIDQTCGFGAAQVGPGGATGNTTEFEQIDLVVQAKMLKEQLCPSSLYNTWISSQLTPSTYLESVPFEEQIAESKIKSISQFIENTIYQGDGATLDGLLAQATVANGAIGGTGAGITVPLTVGTAFETIFNIINKLSNALKQENDLVMYMSPTNYLVAVQSLLAQGNSILGQYPNISNITSETPSTFTWPGTNITIYSAGGLNDNDAILLYPRKYLYFGCGLIDDQDNFRFFYDPSQDIVSFRSSFKLGTAAYASQGVSTI